MLKFLLIIFLISYIIYKVGGFFFKMLFLKATQQQYQRNTQTHQSRKAPGGNVNIDYVPENRKSKKDGFSGGDYVEYEDVKE